MGKGKLTTKLPSLAEALKKGPTVLATDGAATSAKDFAARGGQPAIDRVRQLNLVLGIGLPVEATDVPGLIAALDKAWAWLVALNDEIDKLPGDNLTAVITSSIGGVAGNTGPLSSALDDVIMCLRRGRAVQTDYLKTAVEAANRVI